MQEYSTNIERTIKALKDRPGSYENEHMLLIHWHGESEKTKNDIAELSIHFKAISPWRGPNIMEITEKEVKPMLPIGFGKTLMQITSPEKLLIIYIKQSLHLDPCEMNNMLHNVMKTGSDTLLLLDG